MPATSRIGAHVSTAGGLVRGTLARADALQAEAIQVFVANPRGWHTAEPTESARAVDAEFAERCAVARIPVFVHAPYLINFGSPSPETRHRSIEALAFSLRRGAAIGAGGVVVHAGSAVLGLRRDEALAQMREAVLPLLDDHPTRLLIEPTAGGGGALASDLDSTAEYLGLLDDRVGLCLDLCHLHAAGHDLSTVDGMTGTFRRAARLFGRGRIGLLHVNDSRDPCGSKRDRHAPIGAGTIGEAGFAALFTAPSVRGVPMVVETEETGHAADIATLKGLRDHRG